MLRGHQSEIGQTTIELLATVSLLVTTLAGMGYLFKAEWERGHCAYLAFEKTHAVAMGALPFSLVSSVLIADLPDSVRGTAFCGGSPEMISIPKLEAK
jgi:hypothetical protein